MNITLKQLYVCVKVLKATLFEVGPVGQTLSWSNFKRLLLSSSVRKLLCVPVAFFLLSFELLQLFCRSRATHQGAMLLWSCKFIDFAYLCNRVP